MGKVRIKGKKKLDKAILAEVIPFGIQSAKLSNEYAYYYEDESISYKLNCGAVEDEWFNEFLEERFGYKCKGSAESFVLSILHEVGHHKANDEIEGAILDFCNTEKERIDREMQDADAERSKVLEWQYFNLPDEIMATQWAINYAKKHPKKIIKMWKAIEPVIIDLYRKNLNHEIFEELNK